MKIVKIRVQGGSPPHAASSSFGREGVTITNSTEVFPKGFLQSHSFHKTEIEAAAGRSFWSAASIFKGGMGASAPIITYKDF